MGHIRQAVSVPILIVLAALLALPAAAVADDCLGFERPDIQWTTPVIRFSDNNDGTLTDGITGLVWMRCPIGQTWTGEACDGEVATFDWRQALVEADGTTFAGSGDWRLPNIKELASIVEQRCRLPAQNATLFPATGDDVAWEQGVPPVGPGDDDTPPVPEAYIFWTSSPYAGDIGNASYAWTVDFKNGIDIIKTRSDRLAVRLVRTVPPPQP